MRDSIGQTAPCPTFYQFVVDSVMEEIVKTKFPIIPQPSEPETVMRQLDFKEQCMWSPIYIRSSNKGGQKNSEYFCKVKGEKKGTVVLP